MEFVKHDGRPPEKEIPTPPAPFSLTQLKEKYLDVHAVGAMEANSLATARMHLGHFEKTLGGRFAVRHLALTDLQRHVSERSRKKYRGKALSAVTLKKEMASFRAAWNGEPADLLTAPAKEAKERRSEETKDGGTAFIRSQGKVERRVSTHPPSTETLRESNSFFLDFPPFPI